MNLGDAFRRALKENEDDTTTRLVYADWLDEQGEHEEADRQRKWPAAKAWILRLCQGESARDEESLRSAYQTLMDFGQYVADEDQRTNLTVPEEAVDVLRGHFDEFFENWSIVTGNPLPPHLKQKSFYWECCAVERYWIGGAHAPPEE